MKKFGEFQSSINRNFHKEVSQLKEREIATLRERAKRAVKLAQCQEEIV